MTKNAQVEEKAVEMRLTTMEQLAFEGSQSKIVLIQQRAEAEVRLAGAQNEAIRHEIESRVGLPAGSLGVTHVVDMATGKIIERSAEPTPIRPDVATDVPPAGENTPAAL